jgi:capsular polysaccharide biosynthesis protein
MKLFPKLFWSIAILVIGVGVGVVFYPVKHQATAKIKVLRWSYDQEIEAEFINKHQCGWYDGCWAVANIEFITSQKILSSVIANVNLGELWKRNKTTNEVLKKLASDTIVQKCDRRNELPWVIAITVKSRSENEAVAIANGIAEAYQNYQNEKSRDEIAAGLTTLQQMLQEMNTESRNRPEDLLNKKLMETKINQLNEALTNSDFQAVIIVEKAALALR